MAELRFRVMAGIVAAGLALGVAELLAAFIGPDSAPPNALGSTVIDHTPDGVREWVIQTFGTNDKTLLFTCMALVAVLVAGFAGAVERTAHPRGSWLLAALGLLTAAIAIGRTGLSAAWPTIIGVAAGIYALRVLTARIDDAVATTLTGSPRPEAPTEASTSDDGTSARPQTSGSSSASSATPEATAHGSASSSPDASAPAASSAIEPATEQAVSDTESGTKSPSLATPRSTADSPRGAAAGPAARAVAAAETAPTRQIATERSVALPQRRQLLRGIAITGGLALLSGVGGRLIGAQRRNVSGERAAIQLPEPSAPAVPLAPDTDLKLPGLTPYLTSNSDFYRIDTALIVPQVSVDDWSLRIHGMVDREIVIGWGDLAKRTAVETLVTLACVSNPVGGDLIGNARWRGYRLAELLAEAGPHPDADMVLSHSIDGFTAGSPLAVLTDGRDALLAVGMNGEPLPVAHGYPARLVVPGLYGYVSATKWVTELEITRFDRATAYWTRRGWSANGPIKTGTRIDTPRARGKVKPGSTPIAGVAWAQHRGIRAVEVQIDDGPWQPARLSTEQSIDTWRQWVYDWNATSGSHTIRARATDGTGETQTADRAPVVPDGATGYPSATVQVG
ncbi:molybdopterin-dependent oxidoreductase [Nocardia sp. NBC_00565]|uniref:molybdopterin-dependent oxidoreductase n=1 Tax=Nocardia sp. NBC_00565 TaxID=2975993 RepID=UPI002E81022A|nr:molybdopterin-dependent oxidoreductase [Nocardia sp. NBC_00565]WUC00683.1 molybdopterin-dependent oxidoreductase [Nocardia sp. NBC_00565]